MSAEQDALKSVRLLAIPADRAGQRIDNFLIAELKGVPKSRIYRILRKGEVRVNGKRVKPEYRLVGGDQVRIPPLRVSEAPIRAMPSAGLIAELAQRIIFEDDRLLIINKPAGLAVHGGSGVQLGLIEALRLSRPQAHYLELVHRLDRDTSGCLIVAKKRSALRECHRLLREGEIEKIYFALVKGKISWPKRTVSLPLQKSILSSGERMVRVEEGGKMAITELTRDRIIDQCTLLKVRLHTGRTHQIRVHCAHIGHPIVGDNKYGDKPFNKEMRGQGLKRLFLHAYSLRFVLDGKPIEVKAKLDEIWPV